MPTVGLSQSLRTSCDCGQRPTPVRPSRATPYVSRPSATFSIGSKIRLGIFRRVWCFPNPRRPWRSRWTCWRISSPSTPSISSWTATPKSCRFATRLAYAASFSRISIRCRLGRVWPAWSEPAVPASPGLAVAPWTFWWTSTSTSSACFATTSAWSLACSRPRRP